MFAASHEPLFGSRGRRRKFERVFAPNTRSWYRRPMTDLTPRQRQVLEFIDAEVRHRGYPPSVREIGEAVGLSSTSTVHAHLAALQDKGYLTRDPTKPRAIEVHLDVESGAAHRAPAGAPRPAGRRRRRRHRRARGGEHRGDAAGARGLHRRRRPLHAPGPRRLDDRGRHLRRRLRRRAPAAGGRRRATSSSPASRAKRPRSRRSSDGATRSCSGPRTPRWTRWSSTRATSRSTARSSRSSGASDLPSALVGEPAPRPEHAVHAGLRRAPRRRTRRAWRTPDRSTPASRARPGCGRARDRRARSSARGSHGTRSGRRRSTRAWAARGSERPRTKSATSGLVRFGGAAACAWRISTSSAPSSSARTCASASSGEYFGANRRLTMIVQRSGTTLCLSGIPPSMPTTWSASRYSSPSTSTRRSRWAARRASTSEARWMALRPIHGRAAWARSPSNPARATSTPWHPASTHPSVGSSSTAKSAASSSGRAANTCRSPLNSSATSSPS